MKLYGLIGYPLTHSFSKQYFTDKFNTQSIYGCTYENFEIAGILQLPHLLKTHPNLCGLNVTIPYKQSVLDFLDEKSNVVKNIHACNCIKVIDGKLIGYNTDVVGFQNSLQKQLQPNHNKALVLGTGGASQAVQYALTELGIKYMVVSRNKKQDEIGYEDLDEEKLNGYPLIINTTPLGMYPNTDAAPSVPYDYITSDNFLYDLIYNPARTKFLHEGEKRGAQICNGHEMLIGQAEESWRIWNYITDE